MSSFLILKEYARTSVAHSTSYYSGTKGCRDLRFVALDRRLVSHSAVKGHFVTGKIGTELEFKKGFLKYLKLHGRSWKFLEIPLHVHMYTAVHILTYRWKFLKRDMRPLLMYVCSWAGRS